jgi:hypothetical protein
MRIYICREMFSVVFKIRKSYFLWLIIVCLISCVGCKGQKVNEVFAENKPKSILVVSLDDRPVNIDYPLYLAEEDKITLSNSIQQNTFAERIETIENELNTGKYNGLVLSFDNLLYGGLMESRVVENPLSEKDRKRIKQLLKTIKSKNILAYGFTSAQRVATNIYSDEDLERYKTAIKKNTQLTNGNFMSATQTEFVMSEEDRLYYQHRANKLKDTVFLLEETTDYFEEFYVAKDDTQHSGIQRYELHSLEKIAENSNIYFVNGTDELVSTLIYKVLYEGEKPKVYIYKTSEEDFQRRILPFEGATLENLLKEKQQMYHFEQVDLEAADFIWIIHNGKSFNRDEVYELLKTNKTLMLTDLNIGNVEQQLLTDLFKNNQQGFSNIDVYCSWNTTSNMIGLTLSQGFLIQENSRNQLLLEKRILKDYVYHSILKRVIRETYLEENADQYNIVNPKINQYILSEMNDFLEQKLKTTTRVEKITIPWKRLFEISIDFKQD